MGILIVLYKAAVLFLVCFLCSEGRRLPYGSPLENQSEVGLKVHINFMAFD